MQSVFQSDGEFGNAFYGLEVEQVIKDEVVSEVTSINQSLKDKISQDNQKNNKDLNFSDHVLEDVTLLNDSEAVEPNSFEDKILKALADKKSKDEAGNVEIVDQEASVFAKYTDIELNDAAAYYKQKVSHLEKALLGDGDR